MVSNHKNQRIKTQSITKLENVLVVQGILFGVTVTVKTDLLIVVISEFMLRLSKKSSSLGSQLNLGQTSFGTIHTGVFLG